MEFEKKLGKSIGINCCETSTAFYSQDFFNELSSRVDRYNNLIESLNEIAPYLECGSYRDCHSDILLNLGKEVFQLLVAMGVRISDIDFVPHYADGGKYSSPSYSSTITIYLKNAQNIVREKELFDEEENDSKDIQDEQD